MEEIINGYQDYMQALTLELQKSAEGFVRIGYLLHMATVTDVLAGSGYDNVYDFAMGEFGLESTQVSRFININKKFSEGGYSDHLLPQYEEYGWSKLAVMLSIPEEIIEEISPAYSKAELTAIKDEVKEELSPEAPSDLEVLMEHTITEYDSMSLMEKALHEYMKSSPEVYADLYEAAHSGRSGAIFEVMAPAGEKTVFVRVDAVGKVSITITAGSVAVYAIRSGEAEKVDWQQAEEFIRALTGSEETDPPVSVMWTAAFHTPYPVQEERKPVEAEQKPEKKTSRVEKTTKKEEKKPAAAEKKPEIVEKVAPEEAEEIAPAQQEIMPAPEEEDQEEDKTVPFDAKARIWEDIKETAEAIGSESRKQWKERSVVRVRMLNVKIRELCDQIDEMEEV